MRLVTGIVFALAFLFVAAAIGSAATTALAPRQTLNTTSTTISPQLLSTFIVNEPHYSANLSVPSGDSLIFLTGVNFTTLQDEVVPLTSVSQYQITQSVNFENQTQLLFVPLNGTTASNSFQIHVVSTAARNGSALPNFIEIEENIPSHPIPIAGIKNITWIGSVTLDLNISTTTAKNPQGWSFLFGSTGIGGNPNITGLDVQIFFGALGGILMAVGVWRKNRAMKFVGFFFLSIVLFTFIGIVPILAAVGIYLLGWLIITLAWKYRKVKK